MRAIATAGNKVERVSLGEFGKLLPNRKKGLEVQLELDARLRRLAPGGVLALDFAGVEMMDYSFSDSTFGTLYARMAAKEYPDKFLVITEVADEVGEALMENVEVALKQREVAALVLPDAALTEFAANDGERHSEPDWRVVGELPGHLVETLAVVMGKMHATVRDVSQALGLESLTACNNRMTKLHQLHLVRRTAEVVPEGGKQWAYSAIV